MSAACCRLAQKLKNLLGPELCLRLAELRGRVPRPPVSLRELRAWARARAAAGYGPEGEDDTRIHPGLGRRARARLSAPELLPGDRVIRDGLAAPPPSPRLSVIIVTYGNLALTRLCLRSVARHTRDCEVLVVDNASPDATPCWLRSLRHAGAGLRLWLNRENRGFARANNQALAAARGRYLVLLNNDTIVPPDWFAPLAARLDGEDTGLVGPCTNHAGNEAVVGVPYRRLRDMELYAAWRRERFAGRDEEPGMLAMFCVALRRRVYLEAGGLDERFGLGMFEDDDYSRRVRGLGLRPVLAMDAFVHHFQMAAFGKLKATGEYRTIYERNRRLYLEKWGESARG